MLCVVWYGIFFGIYLKWLVNIFCVLDCWDFDWFGIVIEVNNEVIVNVLFFRCGFLCFLKLNNLFIENEW